MTYPKNDKELNKQRIIALLIIGPIPVIMFIIGAILFRGNTSVVIACIAGAISFFMTYMLMILRFRNNLKKIDEK